mgnify:CR=1 FL=1
MRGFVDLQHIDPGFQPTASPWSACRCCPKRYATYEQRIAFTENVLGRVRNIRGSPVGRIGNGGLPFGGPQSSYAIEASLKRSERRMVVGLISADYQRTAEFRY